MCEGGAGAAVLRGGERYLGVSFVPRHRGFLHQHGHEEAAGVLVMRQNPHAAKHKHHPSAQLSSEVPAATYSADKKQLFSSEEKKKQGHGKYGAAAPPGGQYCAWK